MKSVKEDLSQVVFKRSEKANLSDHKLDVTLQNVVWAMDGKRSLDVIAREDHYDLEDLSEKANQLLMLGVIEPHKSSHATIDQTFVHFLSRQLSKSIGPVTSILISDTAEALGHPLTMFPVNKLPHLIDLLSQEIQGNEDKAAFKQAMSRMAKEKNY